MKKTAVIFDIDNTLANINHRLHYIERKPKNWVAFFQYCSEDPPIESVIGFANQIGDAGHELLFMTGRREEEYVQTIVWLHKYIKHPYILYMRPKNDFSKDFLLKANHVAEAKKHFDILFALDDKLEVAQMYKKFGIPTLHLTWDNTK